MNELGLIIIIVALLAFAIFLMVKDIFKKDYKEDQKSLPEGDFFKDWEEE